MWVDTHCHLQLTDGDATELLDRAPQVDWVVTPGVDLASSRAAVALAEKLPDRVFAAVGLHPHEAEKWPDERDELVALMDRAVAVGETGLDFYRNLAPRDAQITAFTDQMHIAADLDKPFIVHCRDAFADVHQILEASGEGERTVLHCWTGGRKWARRFLDLGVTFSFAGPVAFKTGETIRLAASVIPPQRALVETDTPYLSPPPFRGETNEPARVAFVGAALGEVWGMESSEVAAITTANATRIFRA
jgi:TatD DNase family protein